MTRQKIRHLYALFGSPLSVTPPRYFGDDCGSCGPSYWPTSTGLCLRQFINGKTLYQLQAAAPSEAPAALPLGPLTTSHFVAIVACGGSLVLLVAAAVACLFVRKSRKVADKAKAEAAAEEEEKWVAAAAAAFEASSMGKPHAAASVPSTPVRFRRNAEKHREAVGLGYHAGSPPGTPFAPYPTSPTGTPSAVTAEKARKGDGRDAHSNRGGISPSPRHVTMDMRQQEDSHGGNTWWGGGWASPRDRAAVRDQQVGAGGWPASPAGVCILPQSTRREEGAAGAPLWGGGRHSTSPRAGPTQPSEGSGRLGWARLLGLGPPAAGPPGSPDTEAGRRGSAGSSPSGDKSLSPIKTRHS